ncbi:MAG TPA: hypothetical protein VF388_03520, partial [Lacunisphaera sp.]
SMTPDAPLPPRLAPPGAGLPPLELAIARRLFALRCVLTSRDAALRLIAHESVAIPSLLAGRTLREACERVLIPRPRGLEDSSRYWSAYMVLEHLRIVNTAIAGVIEALVAGQKPPHVASTAAVKPSPGVGAEVLSGFAGSCTKLLVAGQAAPSLRTATRFAHPWFGPLDAARWQVLGGMHMSLHRRQIGLIFSTLAAAPTGAE